MRKMKNYWIMTMLAVLAFASCKEDEIVDMNPTTQKVAATVHGIVSDESGSILSDVQIFLDGNSTTTDQYGNFVFADVSIPTDNAYLTASKSGYFNGSRTFQPVKNSINKVRITLMDKGIAIMVDGANGGDANLGDGTKISLAANGVKTADGSTYSGMVSVYAKLLNPTDPDMLSMMPGDLIAEDLSGEEQALETYGMIVVELEGSSGEALNIADGSTAEITIPMDASVASGAPSSIPLWYFDETTGIWTEEGSATLVGDKYVGEVSHFSFWNCDAPFPIVKITGTIENDGVTLSNVLVKVSRTNGSTNRPSGSGYTDTAGVFCGKMPANETLLLEVMNQCGEAVSSTTIGPFNADQNIGTIDADVSANVTTVVGSAIDCDNNTIADVYIAIRFGSIEEYYLGSGSDFSIPIIYCDGITEIEIRIIDIANEKESGWLTFPITPTTTNVGNVLTCDGIGEYVSFTIDGNETLIYININAFLEEESYHGVYGDNGQNTESINYSIFNGDTTASFGVGTYVIDNSNQSYFSASDGINNYYGASIALTYTSFGDFGELIEGTFSGTVNFDSTSTENISGVVHVIREF